MLLHSTCFICTATPQYYVLLHHQHIYKAFSFRVVGLNTIFLHPEYGIQLRTYQLSLFFWAFFRHCVVPVNKHSVVLVWQHFFYAFFHLFLRRRGKKVHKRWNTGSHKITFEQDTFNQKGLMIKPQVHLRLPCYDFSFL